MTESTRARLRRMPSLTGTKEPVDPASFPDEPVTAFLTWLDEAEAAGVPEPHVMALSTVDAAGVPDTRMLILKDVDERGWAFATTDSSRKGGQLAANQVAALTFWWQPQIRSVRIRGAAVQASPEESLRDLRARAPEAQAEIDPDDWTLWWVQPTRVEFWQGSPDRRDTRLVYTQEEGEWRFNPRS